MSTYNGSPFDRGYADYYYGRRFRPHKRVEGDDITDLTKTEKAEYKRGYDEAFYYGDEKDWT